jgi:hypothetical protein
MSPVFAVVISIPTASAQEPTYKLSVAPDKSSVEMTFPSGPAKLKAQDLERLISNLAAVRSTMEPQVAQDLAPGSEMHGVSNPRWYIQDGPRL